jgi:O-methyltransferase involved in polyketide biosynthesis
VQTRDYTAAILAAIGRRRGVPDDIAEAVAVRMERQRYLPNRDAAWIVEGFWMFDDEQVMVELVSGHLTVTQPREIAMYAQAFGELAGLAVYGGAARSLIVGAVEAVGG